MSRLLPYIEPIRVGVIIFPFVVLLITLPIMLYNYRKYGAVSSWKMVLNYSFVFYLICAYFLTILPLPSIEWVKNFHGPKQNLHLFLFVREFFAQNPHFSIQHPYTWITALKSSGFIQPAFNFLLTLPFGCYLRYKYKLGFFKTLILSFLLTLSFESIQRSALFGIYPRPYRLFDVDDLMINTCGSLFGYLLAAICEPILPNIERINKRSAMRSEKISLIRRSCALMVDGICMLLPVMLLPLHLYISLGIGILLFFFLPELIFQKTFGMRLVHLEIRNAQEEKATWLQRVLHVLLGVVFNTVVWLAIFAVLDAIAKNSYHQFNVMFALLIFLLVLLLAIFIDTLISIFRKKRQLWFEMVTKTLIDNTYLEHRKRKTND